MKIYLAHPISGCSKFEVLAYYSNLYDELAEAGYEVLSPMKGKANIRVETEYRAHGYGEPVVTNHSIFNRDHWMVSQSDIVYADLTGAKQVSIGTMMELAWASHMGKYVVLAMEKNNPHAHAFVFEAAHTVFPTSERAIEYLVNFNLSEGI